MYKLIFLSIAILLSQGYTENIRLKLARQYRDNGQTEKAISEYRAALVEDPMSTSAFMELGEIRMQQGEYHRAVKNFQEVVRLDPVSIKGFENMAKSYEQLKHYEKSIENWRKVADFGKGNTITMAEKEIKRISKKIINPTNRTEKQLDVVYPSKDTPSGKSNSGKNYTYNSPDFQKGKELYHARKDKEALLYWRKILKKEPGNPGAYYFAGVNRYNLNQLKKAEYNFRRSFDYPEKGFNAYYYLGRISEKRNEFGKAVQNFKQYLKHTQSAKGKKEVQGRIAKLNKKIEIHGDNSSPGKVAKKASKNLKNPEKVELMEGNHYYVIHDLEAKGGHEMALAWKSIKSQKMNQAIDKLKKVLMLYPKSPNTYAVQYNLLHLYHMLGLYEQAQNVGEVLLMDKVPEPYFSPVNYWMAMVHKDLEDYSTAKKYLGNVLETSVMGPEKTSILELASEIAESNEDNLEGVAALRKAINQEKNSTRKDSLRMKLAGLYLKANRKKQGKQTLRKINDNCSKEDKRELCKEVIYKMADIYYQEKNWGLSKKYYIQATEQFPDSVNMPWAYYQLGNIYRNRDNSAKAIHYFDKLMTEHPKSYWAEQAKWKKEDTIWRKDFEFAIED